MEPGIENFAGVIIQGGDGRVLLLRKEGTGRFALPWCRILQGRTMAECLRAKVRELVGLAIAPEFLSPNEHIVEETHYISFDHLARVPAGTLVSPRPGLEVVWAGRGELASLPVVPLTAQVLDWYFSRPA